MRVQVLAVSVLIAMAAVAGEPQSKNSTTAVLTGDMGLSSSTAGN